MCAFVLAIMAIDLEKEYNIGLRSKALHCRKYVKSQVIRGKGGNLIHSIYSSLTFHIGNLHCNMLYV